MQAHDFEGHLMKRQGWNEDSSGGKKQRPDGASPFAAGRLADTSNFRPLSLSPWQPDWAETSFFNTYTHTYPISYNSDVVPQHAAGALPHYQQPPANLQRPPDVYLRHPLDTNQPACSSAVESVVRRLSFSSFHQPVGACCQPKARQRRQLGV